MAYAITRILDLNFFKCHKSRDGVGRGGKLSWDVSRNATGEEVSTKHNEDEHEYS